MIVGDDGPELFIPGTVVTAAALNRLREDIESHMRPGFPQRTGPTSPYVDTGEDLRTVKAYGFVVTLARRDVTLARLRELRTAAKIAARGADIGNMRMRRDNGLWPDQVACEWRWSA